MSLERKLEIFLGRKSKFVLTSDQIARKLGIKSLSELGSAFKNLERRHIIPLKDLKVIIEKENGWKNVEVSVPYIESIRSYIKRIPDMYGNRPYQSSKIEIDVVPLNSSYTPQNYVLARKLLGISRGLIEFLLRFGYNLSEAQLLVITYDSRNFGKLGSIYVPLIVEVHTPNSILEAIERLKERINKGKKYVTLELYNPKNPDKGEEIKIDLKKIVAFWEEKFTNNSHGSFLIVRDGNHRTYYMRGIALGFKGIIIYDSQAKLIGVPIPLSWVKIVRKKPAREDGFLAWNSSAWMDYHGVGIDG